MTAPSSTPTRPQIGELVNNKYRLVRLLGDGGMGSVFEAKHELLGSAVALKFLHPELAKRAGLVQRFLQEARVSAVIQSPHVVRVSDVEQTSSGLPFMVMELLHGRSLQTLYEDLYKAGKRLGFDDALDYARQMLDGLEAAHDASVVHRDLKPDNVMIVEGKRGEPLVKLLDFGIAKLRINGELYKGLTRPGVIMGTPEYMAPEQVFKANEVDARADIFSCGVMLFEMLSGRRPVAGEEAHQIAAQYLNGNVAQLTRLAPHVPTELCAIVHRAMAANPDQRFGAVAEFRAALAPFGKATPASIPGAGPTTTPVNDAAPRPAASPVPAPVPKTIPPEESAPAEPAAAGATNPDAPPPLDPAVPAMTPVAADAPPSPAAAAVGLSLGKPLDASPAPVPAAVPAPAPMPATGTDPGGPSTDPAGPLPERAGGTAIGGAFDDGAAPAIAPFAVERAGGTALGDGPVPAPAGTAPGTFPATPGTFPATPGFPAAASAGPMPMGAPFPGGVPAPARPPARASMGLGAMIAIAGAVSLAAVGGLFAYDQFVRKASSGDESDASDDGAIELPKKSESDAAEDPAPQPTTPAAPIPITPPLPVEPPPTKPTASPTNTSPTTPPTAPKPPPTNTSPTAPPTAPKPPPTNTSPTAPPFGLPQPPFQIPGWPPSQPTAPPTQPTTPPTQPTAPKPPGGRPSFPLPGGGFRPTPPTAPTTPPPNNGGGGLKKIPKIFPR